MAIGGEQSAYENEAMMAAAFDERYGNIRAQYNSVQACLYENGAMIGLS